MRNRMYGGVRGRKTKVGGKLLRFPPTRFFLPCQCGVVLYWANAALFRRPNAALFRRVVPLFILLSQVAAVCTFGMSII